MKRAVMFFTIILAMTMTTSACGSSTSSAGSTVSAAASSGSSETAGSADSVSPEDADHTDDSAKSDASDDAGSADASDDAAGSGEKATDDAETSADTTGLVTPISSLDLADMFSKRDQDASYDVSSSTKISLNDTTAEVSGSGAKADGSTVTITQEGTYIVSGTLSDGQIVVEADDSAKVQIVLYGVSITNDDSACILVRAADKVFVTLADGTDNTLSDTGTDYVQESEDYTVDGVIFSREDLTLNGSGTLTVSASYKHAVVSKDDLVITGGTYEITAKNKGLAGKDSVRILDGTVNITSGDDAIHTSNSEDAGKGFIYIEGGTLNLAAGDDGIHAETALVIAGGSIDVTESYEGLEGATIDIKDGTINIKASDDGMNASISDGDSDKADGIENDGHMFRDMQNSSGTPDDQNVSEQIPEGNADAQITANTVSMTEQNADEQAAAPMAGMTEKNTDMQIAGDALKGRGGMGGGGMMDAQPDAYLRISGGTIHVNAEGDGLDSNGMLYVDGGEITVSGPTNSGNGALDYGTGAEITGGTIIAAGSIGMAETFGDSSTQYSILYNFDSTIPADTEVSLADADGNTILSFTPEKTYQSVVVSSPDIKEGTYTVKAGSSENTVEVSSVVTTAGAEGGMMGMGGRGGFGDGQRPGGENGFGRGQRPDGENGFGRGQRPDGENGFG